MLFVLKICIICTFLIGVILAAGYLYDRFPHSQNPAPPTGLSAQQIAYHYESYIAYTEVVIDCVSENYYVCGLARPGVLAQHMAPCDEAGNITGIVYDPKFGVVYQVYFDRAAYDAGGMEHNTSFSVTDCRTMAQKLNSRLSNFCLAHGCPPCSIVAAEDVEGGVVRFTLGRVR